MYEIHSMYMYRMYSIEHVRVRVRQLYREAIILRRGT